MKALFITGKGSVQLRDVTTPQTGPGELLVRMRVCGVCGTDLEKVHGDHITPPVLGHEVAGVMEEVGTKVTGFSVGDRVAVHHHISCRHCQLCNNGFETLCAEYPKENLDPCGFAELFRVPEALVNGGTVYRLPDSVTFEEGSQVEPIACCLRALNKVGVKAGSTVAIFGLGPVGLSHLQLLKGFGVTQVYAVDIIKKRREYATKLGANSTFDPTTEDVPSAISKLTGGNGVDLAIVATGSMKALESAFGAVRKGGTVLLFGAPGRGSMLSLDMSKVFLREVRFLSSYSTSETEMRMALDLIASRRIKPAEIISDRLPLARALEAIGIADRATESIKVIVENS